MFPVRHFNRRIQFLIAFSLCVVIRDFMASLSAAEAADGKNLKAGAYAVDITPPEFPVSSNGGIRDRMTTFAHDPLHARCLVLENGESRIAIAVVDSCMVPRELLDIAKKKAEELTGIPTDKMLISATHTHTAVSVAGVFQSEPEEEYGQFLASKIAKGLEQAASQLEPARVGWAVGNNPRQVFNRRWYMRPGFQYDDPFDTGSDRVRMNPPRGNTALLAPAGPIDPEIVLLSLQSTDGRPIALLANYSLHYVGGVPSQALSADYFGEFARQFSEKIQSDEAEPAFVAIMSNGTSGDINNVNFFTDSGRQQPFEQIRLVASDVADSAYEAYQRIAYHDWVPIKMQETEVELGVRKPSGADVARAKRLLDAAGQGPYSDRREIYARETLLLAEYPATVRAKLQAIRIGNLGIVSSPCETFVETGLAVKKQSPLRPTFTIELANGYNGYLPTPEHHALGGYETWRARSSYLAADAEPTIRSTLLKLLAEVAEE